MKERPDDQKDLNRRTPLSLARSEVDTTIQDAHEARSRERRGQGRLAVSLPGSIRIPLDGEDDLVLVAKATVENISPLGIRLRIHSLTPEHFGIVRDHPQRCSVVLRLPGASSPVVLSGSIAWSDYHGDRQPAHALVGVDLSLTEPAQRLRFEEFMQTHQQFGPSG